MPRSRDVLSAEWHVVEPCNQHCTYHGPARRASHNCMAVAPKHRPLRPTPAWRTRHLSAHRLRLISAKSHMLTAQRQPDAGGNNSTEVLIAFVLCHIQILGCRICSFCCFRPSPTDEAHEIHCCLALFNRQNYPSQAWPDTALSGT